MKKRILLVSLILIMMIALALPAMLPAAEAPAPVLTAAPAPALELAEEGAAAFSVVGQIAPVSAQEAQLQLLAAGLILVTIVASVAYFRRDILTSIGQLIAYTRSPGTSGVLKYPLACG